MSGLLKGKTALILGIANRWSLAYAIADAFRRHGARLLLTYQGERQKPAAEELAADLGAAQLIACDVSDDSDLERLASALGSERLDAVVHSIAFADRADLTRPFIETSRTGFLLAHEVSVYSLISVARLAAPLMKEGGAIITLTYLGSTRVIPNYNVMGVAKAALEAAVRYLASELGPRGIRVNTISAGPVKTASARAIKDFSGILEVVAERAPLRRNTTAEDVGGVAVFLASELSSGVTGQVIFADSGFHIMGL